MEKINLNGQINVSPEDIRYDETGIWIREDYKEVENPRLEFARLLSHFKQEEKMIEHNHSYFLTNTSIGKNVIIGPGCVIGGNGFGYEYEEDGNLIPMPHLGNIVIEDNVTLHNNICIDRAVIGSTIIGEGTKIDNLVHVAHGVKIGKRCLIVSGVVFGGSCEVGDYCFVGMNACIKQRTKIGKNCVIGAGAVVTKDIPDNQIWVGNPARYLKDVEPRKYQIK